MSNHKLIAFSQSNNLSYMEIQLNAIKKLFPLLEVEVQNQNDPRIRRYVSPGKAEYLPILMMFKNNVYQNHVHGKQGVKQIEQWIKKLGI